VCAASASISLELPNHLPPKPRCGSGERHADWCDVTSDFCRAYGMRFFRLDNLIDRQYCVKNCVKNCLSGYPVSRVFRGCSNTSHKNPAMGWEASCRLAHEIHVHATVTPLATSARFVRVRDASFLRLDNVKNKYPSLRKGIQVCSTVQCAQFPWPA